jgi:transcriptional antiterminator NusG
MAKQNLNVGRRWYVLHTYSGYEENVSQNLQQRIESMDMDDKIFSILIPKEKKIKIKNGKRKVIEEKIFPGYMLVYLELTDHAWLAVRTTQGVTGFVGIGNKPTPLPKHEVETIQKYISQGAPQYKADFVEGEAVKITDGPFNEFVGDIKEVNEEKKKYLHRQRIM